MIYYTESGSPNTNINVVLASYYNNNKGVILCYGGLGYGTTNITPPKIITSTDSTTLYNITH